MLLRLENISKRYGSTVALRPTTLEFKPGITAVIGPNGAGKTTMLGIITGMIRPTTGRVVYHRPGDPRRWIRVISTEPNIPPDATVEDYLEFIRRVTGETKKRQKEVIELTQIGDMLAKFIGHLSTGYKKRVSIAAALLARADLIVADEPFAGLDPIYRREIRETFSRLRGELGINFIISSHNFTELEMIAENLILIRNGTVRDIGSIWGMDRVLMVSSDADERLAEYLSQLGYSTKAADGYILVKARDINKLLRDLGSSPVKIKGIQTVTLEEVLMHAEGDVADAVV